MGYVLIVINILGCLSIPIQKKIQHRQKNKQAIQVDTLQNTRK